MRRWQSGQLQWTVNPSDLSYAGSNPARRTTNKRTQYDKYWATLFVAPGRIRTAELVSNTWSNLERAQTKST